LGGSSQHLILTPTLVAFSLAFAVWSSAGDRLRGWLSKRWSLFFLGVLIAVSTGISLCLLNSFQNQINDKMLAIVTRKSVRLIEELLYPAENEFLLQVACISSLPFFFYGLYLSHIFQKTESTKTSLVLASEFFGMILGMISSAVLLDVFGSWSVSFSICFGTAMLGAICVLPLFEKRRPLAIAAAILFSLATSLLIEPWLATLEPQRPLALTLRDFNFSTRIEEIDSNWTTYGKVQHLVRENSAGLRHLIALGGGSGIATLVGPRPFTSAAVEAAKLFPAKNTLVLFAGAGADLVGIYDPFSRGMKVTGVELNPRIFQLGMDEKISRIFELSKTGNVRLVNEEARTYLERGNEKFDQILFSFAGATVAHYSGAIMHTSQYTLTRDALARAWRRLDEGGRLILMPGSKINVLLSLKLLESTGQIQNLADSTMILTTENDKTWQRGWDDQVLIVKKGGFHSEDVRNSLRLTNGTLQVVLAPGFPTDPAFLNHRHLLDSADIGPVLRTIKAETGLVFDDFTDDRPFVHLTRPRTDYSSLAAFAGVRNLKAFRRVFLSPKIFSLILLAALAAGFMAMTVIFFRGAPASRPFRRLSLALGVGLSAVLLGLTSTAVQLVVAYKSVLFVGNPTHALVVSCLATAGGSLVGALLCRRPERISARILLTVTVSSVALFVGIILLTETTIIKSELFQAPLLLRQIIVSVSCLIFSSGLGLAFPILVSEIQRTHQKALHLAIFVDGLACALCAVLGPTLIEDFGLSAFTFGIALMALAAGVCVSSFKIWSSRMSS
jgi:hypothetical protein